MTPTLPASRNSAKSFQCPMSDISPMTCAALLDWNTANASLNIAVELAPSLFNPLSLTSFQSAKTRLTAGEFQLRLPAIQSSYSCGERMPEPRPDRKNWMPMPSLFPCAKHLAFVALAIASQLATNSLQVVAGRSGSSPAFL